VNQISNDPRISDEISAEISVALNGSIQFVSSDDITAALAETSLDPSEAAAIVDAYEDGQLTALRMGLIVATAIVIGALFVARKIPDMSFEDLAAAQEDDEPIAV
jgi:hypothetical protein